jgi:ATP-dependent RNA helicase DDX60
VHKNCISGNVTDAVFQEIHPAAQPKGKKVKADKLSSADKLRQKIQAEKQSNQDVSSQSWWRDQVEAMKKMSDAKRMIHLDAISRNKRSQEPSLAVEILLYRLNFEMMLWVGESDPASVRDKFTLAIMRLVKQIYDHQALTPTVSKALSNVLVVMGFSDYIEPLNEQYRGKKADDRPLSFELMKLVKSKTMAPVYKFMHITEDPVVWQLRLFGEFMDRSMDGQPDRRVAFNPDAWQRNVLDCIDEEGSLLVVGLWSCQLKVLSEADSIISTDECGENVHIILCHGEGFEGF